ncbi:hypothetical protein CFIMG_002218RA [Ceratocystis fimbriata CBS 114723]|uniref:Uncharacterized protein n=1 Tax=Ceratocystis fimbriata CBS 114723 TaxID=1035309 RepID=A0A2C5X0Z3_9PEZI|nr:hypothetical protein CFIMG_002218RA [Ceratocystis fimbriata CBS 114723]
MCNTQLQVSTINKLTPHTTPQPKESTAPDFLSAKPHNSRQLHSLWRKRKWWRHLPDLPHPVPPDDPDDPDEPEDDPDDDEPEPEDDESSPGTVTGTLLPPGT